MGQPTNTFDTYDAVGIREDLLDNIFNLAPDDTPFLSKMGKTTASNTNHEWQTDSLDAPSASNAHIEGDDTTADAITPTVRLGNYTQIFKKAVVIPGTLEATKRAGRGREVSYQLLQKSRAIKTDCEMSIFQNGAKVAGSNVAARKLAGVLSWINTNTSAGTGGADPTGDGTDTRTDGTQRAFTESQLKTVLASIFDNSGKKPDTVYIGSHNKQVQSGFSGSSTRFDRGEDRKLIAAVDIYEYDFGAIRFEPSRHVRARDAVIVASDMWAWAVLRPMKQRELARTGDAEKWEVLTEATLVCRNELASGGVFDLTTS